MSTVSGIMDLLTMQIRLLYPVACECEYERFSESLHSIFQISYHSVLLHQHQVKQ